MVREKIEIMWMPYADNDLHEIFMYISQDNEEQAERVVHIIHQKPNVLKTFPEFGQVVQEIKRSNVREILCFSWRIIYRYKKEEQLIQILTVFHSARELNENVIEQMFNPGI
jgi:toxin ParE1/3/4